MKILEIINSLGTVGGAETFAVSLTGALAKKSDLFVAILYAKNNEFLLRKIEGEGAEKVLILNKKGRIDFRVARQLRKLIKEQHIEVIHTENDGLLSAYFATLFLRPRPKIFHTLHNPAPQECSSKIKRVIYGHCFKKGIAIPVGISNAISESAIQLYHLKKECPIVYNGVNTKLFSSAIPLIRRKKNCVILARMEPQKDYPFVLSVFAEAHRRDPGLSFFIYGQGSQKETIRNLITDEKMDYVHLNGIASDPQTILADTQVFFLGSIYEGNPMSVLEAMSCGCIPVLTRVGGVPDVVKRDNGFLFEHGQRDLMAAQIVEVCSRPERYEKMSLINKQAVAQFDFTLVADRYLQLFNKKLNNK